MEKELIGTGGKVFTWSVMGTEAMSALFDLRWMLVFIVVLIIADFWFGVSESIHNNNEFRFSRAGRRTCNKAVDYLTYLLLGAIIGMAIFEPLGITSHTVTAAIGLGFGCLWEIDSIIGHVCALHGFVNKVSIKRLLITFIKKKNKDVGEAIEEVLCDKNSRNNGSK